MGSKMTRVEIFGTDYSVRSDADVEYTRRVAAYVDEKMKAIAEQQNLVSSTKVAILAAINIADELLKERRRREKTERDVSLKALELADVLEREL